MTLTLEQVKNLGGRGKVVTHHGDKVGAIGQVYLDDQSGEPEWVTVKTGLFGSAESFVPLQGARVDGDNVVVGFDKDTVKAAPRVDADGSLSPDEEDNLYRHYGFSSNAGRVDTTTTTAPVADRQPKRDTSRDTAGPVDDAMTRSEERLTVGTRQVEAGRARLRKYVTTEQVSQTVPVSHEEARVTHEPITRENYDRSVDGPDITEAVHEVTLHAETAVVDKKVVPVERVRMDTATVTEQQTVTDQVRKEQIELEDPTSGKGTKNRR